KEAMSTDYQSYAAQVIRNAQALSASLADQGMRPVSGGTDTHLALIDLRGVGVTGADAEVRCDAARITLNKNAIPYDPQPPTVGSGIRVGTPSVTTQGMGEAEMAVIGRLIGTAVTDPAAAPAVAAEVSELVARFPAYAQTPVGV
ncbi:MAG: serine hydroxymethyltransferase, partial [Actinomycetota bacterium]